MQNNNLEKEQNMFVVGSYDIVLTKVSAVGALRNSTYVV